MSRAESDLRAALDWAMKRLDPFHHEPECSPTGCICGYAEARGALAATPEPRDAGIDPERLARALVTVDGTDWPIDHAQQVVAEYARLSTAAARQDEREPRP